MARSVSMAAWMAVAACGTAGGDASGVDAPPQADASAAVPTSNDASLGDPSVTPSADGATDACAVTIPDAGFRLRAHGTSFEDTLGRTVVLRGVNAGGHSKQAPAYMPFDFDVTSQASFDAALTAYMDRAAAWGVDVLRVPFTWAAVEPTKGSDDATYLARLDALLDAAWARHIWTVVDFHQDVYAEALCGDGFPAWTLPNPAIPHKQNCGLWFSEYQFDSDVKLAFDRFWADTEGVQTAYRALWDRMVARYKDRAGVIGFEPLNEPGWGSAALPVFEATTLRDFYSSMLARINASAPESLVFVDLPGTDGLSLQTTLSRPSGDNLVFAPHYYQTGGLTGALPGNASSVPNDLGVWSKLGTSWGVPTFVGEFGISNGDAHAGKFLSAHWATFDATQLHGTEWEYSASKANWNGEPLGLLDPSGKERAAVVDALVRVYPRAIAGSKPRFSFDPSTRIFSLEYVANAGGVTEIVVPARVYGTRAPAIVVQGGCAGTPLANGIVPVLASSASGTTVKVTIAPR